MLKIQEEEQGIKMFFKRVMLERKTGVL